MGLSAQIDAKLPSPGPWYGAAPKWAVYIMIIGIATEIYVRVNNVADAPGYGAQLLGKIHFNALDDDARIYGFLSTTMGWVGFATALATPITEATARFYEISVREAQFGGFAQCLLSGALHAVTLANFNIEMLKCVLFCHGAHLAWVWYMKDANKRRILFAVSLFFMLLWTHMLHKKAAIGDFACFFADVSFLTGFVLAMAAKKASAAREASPTKKRARSRSRK